ncbi:flavoprotein [Mycolicibacterium conceptionense]|uniref:Flavoprotein n=3 Tax=Mycobacteriaceae TaxID=1762 RepID=A0A0U1DM44_9MYCO|nr:flavoprotein [Mycolicibacterium conceptionense]
MRFAYLSAAAAGVPYLEIAYIPPEIRAFFEYVKQEQQ